MIVNNPFENLRQDDFFEVIEKGHDPNIFGRFQDIDFIGIDEEE